MDQIRQKGLRALTLLEERPYSLDELADKLCICKRYTQKVIIYLSNSHLSIKSRYRGRVKYFWIESSPDLLLTILTPDEKQDLAKWLPTLNSNLRKAIDKITQYTLMQLYFQSQK